MIESFKCSETEKIFHRQFSKKLPQNIQKIAFRKLKILEFPPLTGLKFCLEIEKDNTAFALMINGEYVLNGKIKMHIMLRLLIIIEVTK